MTLLTDLVLGGFTLFWGVRLLRRGRRSGRLPVQLWGWGLTTAAVAAVSGGLFHGLGPEIGALAATVLWKVTVYAVGLAGLAMLAGILGARLRGALLRWCLVLASVEFVLYAIWMTTHDDFRWVVLQYAPVMVVVLAVAAVLWREGRPAGAWIVAGVTVSFAAAGIQQAKLGIHPGFNHNDVYHVVQLVGNYLLYRGGLRLGA